MSLPITSQPSTVPRTQRSNAENIGDGTSQVAFRRRATHYQGAAGVTDNIKAVTNSGLEEPKTLGCCKQCIQDDCTAAGIERKGLERTKKDGVAYGVLATDCCCFCSLIPMAVKEGIQAGTLDQILPCLKAGAIGSPILTIGSIGGFLGLGACVGGIASAACYRHFAQTVDLLAEADTKQEKREVVKEGLKGAFTSGRSKVKDGEDKVVTEQPQASNQRGRLCFSPKEGAGLTLELLKFEKEEEKKKLGLAKDEAEPLRRETEDDY